ncbi:hypothetical protein BDK51DRAFT_44966 [Blyttiomyces helicus]|uniref:Uncharacterized protein n=1 Tax=Blyttiomyces helicus TaxID=388810 RepID=A0A4P9WHV0_9FUNG|nr:hypothetical protein BDK51DRAFT_44966 [Blyttiomyces helicus]|eukprot:RKO91972.1 hypothetical protein BDK51DRAFT_44966 [Blyttiomyces helicus]
MGKHQLRLRLQKTFLYPLHELGPQNLQAAKDTLVLFNNSGVSVIVNKSIRLLLAGTLCLFVALIVILISTVYAAKSIPTYLPTAAVCQAGSGSGIFANGCMCLGRFQIMGVAYFCFSIGSIMLVVLAPALTTNVAAAYVCLAEEAEIMTSGNL